MNSNIIIKCILFCLNRSDSSSTFNRAIPNSSSNCVIHFLSGGRANFCRRIGRLRCGFRPRGNSGVGFCVPSNKATIVLKVGNFSWNFVIGRHIQHPLNCCLRRISICTNSIRRLRLRGISCGFS